jgi:AraC family transcriptional regulator, positive regulator of tynA and feaB
VSTLPPPIWSTDTVPAGQQFAFWREAVCDVFLNIDVNCNTHEKFRGKIDSRDIGKLRLNRIDAQHHHAALDSQGLAKTSKECFYVNFQAKGRCIIKQHGRDAYVEQGQWYVLDSTEPFDLRYDGSFLSHSFEIPHKVLGATTHSVQNITGHVLGIRSGLERYLTDYAYGISKHADQLGEADKEKLCSNFIDLFISTLPLRDSRSSLLGPSRARREQIDKYIEENIEDPQLCPSSIVKSCGISLSTLHSLFNTQEQSVMRYVRTKRLELAYKRLQSFNCRSSSISEISYGCGFSDLSHFCHAFKAYFGQTPRSVRSGALLSKSKIII